MSADLEAAGALVTAGLAAGEIESGTAAKPPEESARPTCANCHTKLAGAYCRTCGQAAHVHRSLWHIFEETLHGVFHFDTKSWRTLPLLLARPGLLTRRYIDGQRVRYVSPLALFLFTVFLMFFVISLVNGNSNFHFNQVKDREEVRAEIAATLKETTDKIPKQEGVAKTAEDTEDRKAAAEELADLQITQAVTSKALDAFDAAAALSGGTTGHSGKKATREKKLAKLTTKFGADSKIGAAVRHSFDDPDLLLYKLKNTAYKYSFMLIPISLPFLWLMFFTRRDIHPYDHAIFSLYSLSFMSLFFTVVALMSTIEFVKNQIGAALLFVPFHMFIQLKETYRLGYWASIWRTLALLCIAGTVFVLFLIMIFAISVV